MAHRIDDDFEEREEVIVEEEVGDQDRRVVMEQANGHLYREEEVYDRGLERRLLLRKLSQFVWLATGTLEGLIAIRILLKLIAANPAAGFANFIYTVTYPFLIPFLGLTAQPTAANGSVLEIPSIIAMIVYALLAWLVVKLLYLLIDDRDTHRVSTYDRRRT